MIRIVIACALGGSVTLTAPTFAQATLQKKQAVSFSQVSITDQFWQPRLARVSAVTIPVCVEQTEIKTPRIRNFEKVARHAGEKHEGMYYDDSDVYKALEAIAYSLKNHPDAALEKKADEWIAKIAAAQQPDGYLNTYYTLTGLDQRWTDMEKHEDYNAGHLLEAAVAYYNTTGKRQLLEVAVRVADNLDATFRQPNRHWVTGHEEIELALVKLANATGNQKYIDLADWYLQQRGHGYGQGAIWNKAEWGPQYCQDGVPVKEQREITGHAVRAMYLYTGAADVGAAKNDAGYLTAMQQVWQDVVCRNMYLTGGIGSSGSNEGFGHDYDLPNEHAYCETCASVGMVLWNQRMNLLTGDSKYADVMERSLYNGALDGLSLSGDRFFYGNPLASSGEHSRSAWFGTACCPSNISRLVESLGNYLYTKTDDAVWVNLFVGSTASIALKKGPVTIAQQTNYPWQGAVQLTVSPAHSQKFALLVRIPGWARNQPVPGTTYHYVDENTEACTLTINGQATRPVLRNGYAVLERTWKKGDVVALNLPMPVRRVVASDSVRQDRNRVALQRGPLVYCFEHPDNKGQVTNILLPDQAQFTARYQPNLLQGVVTLQAEVPVVSASADGSSVSTVSQQVTAIPYYAWANRGAGPMQLWLPRRVASVTLSPQ